MVKRLAAIIGAAGLAFAAGRFGAFGIAGAVVLIGAYWRMLEGIRL